MLNKTSEICFFCLCVCAGFFFLENIYSSTSMARTLMARLPSWFELFLESLGTNSIVTDLG